jgi:hypothetical protein
VPPALARLSDRVQSLRASRVRLAEGVGLCLLILLAVGLRAFHLDRPRLWVDEAESALNALTIVAEGVPGDRILGQPLYENTLVRRWPESAEYEFRDISYSDRGLAIYHAWLPLYSIALAFRLAGVTPEMARHGTPLQNASEKEIARWTVVPRLPALVFSALFVVLAWRLGRSLHSASTGWALALAAASSNILIWFGRQSRYYSATLAGSAGCGLAIWNACRRGRVADHAMAGVAIGTLFHINSLNALAMAGVYAVELSLTRDQPRLWLRVLTTATMSGLLVLPWAVWSGMLAQAQLIPAARHFLDWRAVLWSLPSKNSVLLAPLGLGLIWLLACLVLGERIGARWRLPFVSAARELRFAYVWLTLSYVVFLGGIPAASYFESRLKLVVAVPGLLACALVFSAASRAARSEWHFLPAVAMAGLLVVSRQIPPKLNVGADDRGFTDLVGLVRSWKLGPSGRVFSTPNDHLVLTYYAGRPVQSIAPVRKEWLDDPMRDLVIVAGERFERLEAGDVQGVARGLGASLSRAEAERRGKEAELLTTEFDLRMSGAHLVSSPPLLDDLDRALMDAVRLKTRRGLARWSRGTPFGVFFEPTNYDELWHDFFYWFSDPERRKGAGLNYAACGARARVTVHPSGWSVFDCRRIGEPALVPIGSHRGAR